MNANEITYGIEIECLFPIGHPISVGSYRRGIQVHGLPQGWLAKTDCSIHDMQGYRGVEIVSPILRGPDGLRQIMTVCNALKQWCVRVNPSCGLHVHVGWPAGQMNEQMKGLTHLVASHEIGIFATTGTRSRENGMYCRPIREDYRHLSIGKGSVDPRCAGVSRYHVLNIQNLLTNTRPTVEFRAFAGTTNSQKIIAYVRLCVGLVERSLTMRLTKWDPKTPSGRSPMLRKTGAGLTELTRLLYALGWVQGRVHTVFGDIKSSEIYDAIPLPSIDDSKKELRRLARKYDRGE